jgi:hypothetical protein
LLSQLLLPPLLLLLLVFGACACGRQAGSQ